MVTDIPAEIVHESVRRLINEVERDINEGIINIGVCDHMRSIVDHDQLVNMAAIGIAMSRITQSASMN